MDTTQIVFPEVTPKYMELRRRMMSYFIGFEAHTRITVSMATEVSALAISEHPECVLYIERHGLQRP